MVWTAVLALAGALSYQLYARVAGSDVAQRFDELPIAEAIEAVPGAEGKLVVLHVWATWCPTCRRGLPTLNRMSQDAPPDEVQFVMLSTDEDQHRLESYMSDQALSIPVTRVLPWAPGELTAALASIGATYQGAIPYTAIFDQDGDLVAERTGALDARWVMRHLRASR